MSRRDRKKRQARERASGGFTLSFLDVLSCGLGAAVLLFLIFAAMPRYAKSATSQGGERSQDRRQQARGSVAEQEVRGFAVAVRSVTVRGQATGEDAVVGEWAGIEDDCLQRVHSEGDSSTFVVICPQGLRPSRRATLTIDPPTTELLQGLFVDGPLNLSCDSPVVASAASTVVFVAEGDEPSIRIGNPGALEPCSATTAAL